eukprot:CAMPEP_0184988558 /NCGR_PEP_ID=MMETSP1098-20130426/24524_1 /TAXON_ID=89044 /ORGANISM="Spumella elongata, Strain CCAP 955/1" /LENGTH=45 /DNA_ID= /DNA_START= /DNA_END= /DNA_ORIENTATION=
MAMVARINCRQRRMSCGTGKSIVGSSTLSVFMEPGAGLKYDAVSD